MTTIVEEVAEKILKASDSKTPIPFIRHHYQLTEDTAYSVQDELIRKKREKIQGYKISMTSKATQAIANTNEPAYGTLLSSNLVNSGESISLSELFSPLVEPELIFILTNDLSSDATAEDILNNSTIAAGIEIPDSRYIDWFPHFSLADLLCDDTATGLVVISEAILSPLTFDQLANIKMELFHNGEKISEGYSSAVLGNPATSVEWLVKKLSNHQKSLKKGMVISSGTFISPIRAEEGTYEVKYAGIGNAKVTFTK
ncbi:2-keto-4-pentenoate hydratase [Oceanobacillus piezotolerans]|uniref:2-keto-4-pentenoate hydratase n=1 Tax=Oceanobacillus piezotolerans TaxID=2448030 RepID=A0A498DET4_9BACI|nr:fumarylacetoacetate hydrolase family protein [Oceanobacillus piezotolerans]RLL45514.1 2-keto-4-pentenoate hydratase [Oceanobacillus piezotolerans]